MTRLPAHRLQSPLLSSLRRRAGGLFVLAAAASVATACGLFYCSSCFPAGTLVLTPEGPVAIETLEIGDTVLSWDLESETQVAASVLDTHVHETDPDLFTVKLADDRVIRATADHPFWRPESGDWARADQLAVGDALAMHAVEDGAASADGDPAADLAPVKITGILRDRNAEPVFNIEVSGPGTYFAADALVKYY